VQWLDRCHGNIPNAQHKDDLRFFSPHLRSRQTKGLSKHLAASAVSSAVFTGQARGCSLLLTPRQSCSQY
jgi:hypothetical protein